MAGRLTGDFADWLTGGSGGARLLDRLVRENSLVARDNGGQYRYHPFLRDLLTAELRRHLPTEVPVLAARAARWHAARGGRWRRSGARPRRVTGISPRARWRKSE